MPAPKPVIAFMYDFDKTLCPKDMQEYTFIPTLLGITPAQFWQKANGLAAGEKMDRILAYMYTMLQEAGRAGQPIRRADFEAMGKDIEFFPGVQEWFGRINAYGAKMGAEVQHYIISSGLTELIQGSAIAKNFTCIYACEFHYNVNGVADWPASAVNYTGKTQYLFRINKGALNISDDETVNMVMPESQRPVPFSNMVYIGDGFTDIPCMRLVKANGGHSVAVYPQGGKKVETAQNLLRDGRVNFIAPANYNGGKPLEVLAQQIIQKICTDTALLARHTAQVKGLPGE
ncbi:MAG: haloacid dehalogenase-like hydrolase [Oscillospiraceae bacterium]